jgi:hypothetical protein
MLHHALVTATQPGAQVCFLEHSHFLTVEAFHKLANAGSKMGFTVDSQRRLLRHENGGYLMVRWATADTVWEMAGCQFTHVYTRNEYGKVNSFIESRIRSRLKFEVPMGLYTPYYAQLKQDY